MFNGLDDSGALQDVVSGFHVADHPADFFPYFFIERGSDDFDHLPAAMEPIVPHCSIDNPRHNPNRNPAA